MSFALAVASKLGARGPDNGGWWTARCPFHEDSNPSFGFTEVGYKCHGCGEHGHVNELAERLGLKERERSVAYSQDDALRILRNRGLREETITRFRIEPDVGKRAFRYQVSNGSHRLKAFDGSSPKYRWEGPATGAELYGLPGALRLNASTVYLVEGEPDVWICQQADVAAVSFTSGAGSVPQAGVDALAGSGVESVKIIYDRDAPGHAGRAKAAQALRDAGLVVEVLDLPVSLPPGGDVTNLYNELGRDDAAFRDALAKLNNADKLDAEPWPDNAPDVPGAVEPEALPIQVLPEGLRAHIESVTRSLQVPADLPIMLALGTLSAAVTGRVNVEVRGGWTEPASIYTACILPPASRKSPAFDAMTEPLRRWEAETIKRAATQFLAAQDAVGVAERRLDKAKGDAAKGKAEAAEVEHARLDLEVLKAKVPPDGRLLAGDVTPEAMVLRMAAQGGKLAILEPEPGPLQLLAGRYSDAARLDELKKAWSRETLTVDRVGRESLRVERPALTLALCLQPGVLDRLSNAQAFRDEGVLARFLWCRPDHGLGSRLTGRAVPPLNQKARDRYGRLIERLAESTPTGTVLTMSDDAMDALDRFAGAVEPELGDDGAYFRILDWAGKAVGQSVRVAALLELARWENAQGPPPSEISGAAMESAIALIQALTTHALAVLAPVSSAEELLGYVFRRALDLEAGSTLRDLFERTKGRAAIETMDDLQRNIDELAKRGCLRLVHTPKPGPGRPPSPTIEINPALLKTHSHNSHNSSDEAVSTNSANFANALGGWESEIADPLAVLSEVTS